MISVLNAKKKAQSREVACSRSYLEPGFELVLSDARDCVL